MVPDTSTMRLLELGPFAFTCLALGCSLVTGIVTVLLAAPARRIGLVSRHRRDRFGAGRIPLTGGIGLLTGVVAALIAVRYLPRTGHLVAAVGFWGVGLLDDLVDLRPWQKIVLQATTALVAALLLSASFAYVGLAVFLMLLLVNASNYLDNMDGLLAGVALTQAVALALAATTLGAPVLVCALPAVLFLSLPPARVYLGDSGSHLIGALFALDCLGLLVDAQGTHPRYLLPLAILFAVPLADTATVTISRLRRKRPIFRGGTDHLSHRLVRLGFSVPRAVFVLVLASGVCGVASLLLLHVS